MNYSEIKTCDIANGPGVRTSLFVSGCRVHCKNCFNRTAWDFNAGSAFDSNVQDQVLASLEPAYVEGLTVLGGEPFEPENQLEVADFVKKVRLKFGSCKTIWMFSGYTLDRILTEKVTIKTCQLLRSVDVLVDGPFVQELYDITLRFRGSSNQRLIDVQKTLNKSQQLKNPVSECVVEWQDESVYSTHSM